MTKESKLVAETIVRRASERMQTHVSAGELAAFGRAYGRRAVEAQPRFLGWTNEEWQAALFLMREAADEAAGVPEQALAAEAAFFACPPPRRAPNDGRMTKCLGCGFHVEPEDARGTIHQQADEAPGAPSVWNTRREESERCAKCEACPDMRESYRRGYNAGVEAMNQALQAAPFEAAIRLRRARE